MFHQQGYSSGLIGMFRPQNLICAAAILAGLAGGGPLSRTGAAEATALSSAERQAKLIGLLQSDAPPADKAIACKQLVVCGTRDAVPALAALLPNADLSSWARIALEAIPDPAADQALREALAKVQGRLLIGVINSIGVRRDTQAVSPLVGLVKQSDAEVASAAAAALGSISGDQAAQALQPLLATAPANVRSAVAEGCNLCAEKYLAGGQAAAAVRLYDAVRQAQVPKQRVLEATRGAILARQSAGVPLLVEQLRSTDKGFFAMGLHTARELKGKAVTDAVAAELSRATPDRQAMLLLVLADRDRSESLPAIRQTARTGTKSARLAALGALERLDDVESLPLLFAAAAEEDAAIAKAARTALARLPGQDVKIALLARLPQAEGKTRQVLLELAGERRVAEALPNIVRAMADSSSGIRLAAIAGLGALGQDPQVVELAKLLPKTQVAKERSEIEKALSAMGSRLGANSAQNLSPLMQAKDAELRSLTLRVLPSYGGATALAMVKAALKDQDENVQDEAVRALSIWSNNWPEDQGVAEPLLALIKSGKKDSHRVLGLRGYLRYVEEDKQLNDPSKVAKIKEIVPLLTRPEEKRATIAVLSLIPTAGALELLMKYAAEGEVVEEACQGLVNLAAGNAVKNATRDLRVQALQLVVEKSSRNATKQRASDAIKKIR
jgi:HEAT repeat protein